ncbi:N-acetylmuramate alpha-1-phosphate uridylyltransferase MurU [Dyella silvatica]|uniref:N-acetylmuramate alpha-1-phosphate uridylyltransferase MurU n=1 Tax=Dyella silvatica TaxID=2992128 RepID=UPI00225A17E2|nr:nucleotidyltransferase family protein [Dyella silvatica]
MRHALIFAAGLGERMRPLTEHTPKPLLEAGGKPLIVWHLEKLAAIGVHYVVINTSHLADQFPDTLGDGSRWGLRIRYAYEGPTPLETGGGMLNALPLLGSEPFIALSSDIYSDYDYAALPLEPAGLAHLVMVPNPDWHARGDFALHGQSLNEDDRGERLTFGNIGVYRPAFLDGRTPGRFKLLPLYQQAMRAGQLSGDCYHGYWCNIGTPQQLVELDTRLRGS